MVKRPMNIGNVTKLSVYFTGSGTITYIKYRTCPTAGGTTFPAPPAATCSAEFYLKECDTASDCASKYGGNANQLTCTGTVCYKNNGVRGCQEAAPWP
jgi:hypothetical protein